MQELDIRLSHFTDWIDEFLFTRNENASEKEIKNGIEVMFDLSLLVWLYIVTCTIVRSGEKSFHAINFLETRRATTTRRELHLSLNRYIRDLFSHFNHWRAFSLCCSVCTSQLNWLPDEWIQLNKEIKMEMQLNWKQNCRQWEAEMRERTTCYMTIN